jgi:hypothetical protein
VRDGNFRALIGLGIVALVGHVVLGALVGEGYAIPTTIVGGLAAAVILRGPVGQALARRIQGESTSELPPETVLGELDDLRARLLELEERVDFSERLLTQARKDQGEGE